jgi:hypothetical protein
MDVIKDIALYVILASFMIGALITALGGSSGAVKRLLIGLSLFFFIATAIGFVFSRGLLIFLVFQIIALVLGIYIVIVAGAAVGIVINSFVNKTNALKILREADLGDYVTVKEFALAAGTSEERVLGRINSGYYRGGCVQGRWYVHKTELTSLQPADAPE